MKYRITKYDPRFRDADGCYQKHEWMSWTDIGGMYACMVWTGYDYYTYVYSRPLEQSFIHEMQEKGMYIEILRGSRFRRKRC